MRCGRVEEIAAIHLLSRSVVYGLRLNSSRKQTLWPPEKSDRQSKTRIKLPSFRPNSCHKRMVIYIKVIGAIKTLGSDLINYWRCRIGNRVGNFTEEQKKTPNCLILKQCRSLLNRSPLSFSFIKLWSNSHFNCSFIDCFYLNRPPIPTLCLLDIVAELLSPQTHLPVS